MTTNNDQQTALTPCPFCGTATENLNVDRQTWCSQCGAMGPSQDDETDHYFNAVKRWNIRADLAKPQDEIAEMLMEVFKRGYKAEFDNYGDNFWVTLIDSDNPPDFARLSYEANKETPAEALKAALEKMRAGV